MDVGAVIWIGDFAEYIYVNVHNMKMMEDDVHMK